MHQDQIAIISRRLGHHINFYVLIIFFACSLFFSEIVGRPFTRKSPRDLNFILYESVIGWFNSLISFHGAFGLLSTTSFSLGSSGQRP